MKRNNDKPTVAYWLEFGRKGKSCQIHHNPPDVSNDFEYFAFYREEEEANYRYTVLVPKSRQIDISGLRTFVRNCHENGIYKVFNVTHSDEPIAVSFRKR